MGNKSFNYKRFRNIGVLTIASVYFLILVGGIVRSTGSGMGCPDWPKCFGSWIPPTNINQLPSNYLEIYRDKRLQKNEKLASYLNKLGYTQVARQLLQNPTAYLETDFNVQKTWIEYLNRVVGVLIGFLIILTLFYSFTYFNQDRSIVYLSVLSFFACYFSRLVGFNSSIYQSAAGNGNHSYGIGLGNGGGAYLRHCPVADKCNGATVIL